MGIFYNKNKKQRKEIIRFIDVDFRRDLNKKRSTTIHVYLFGGRLVSWRLMLQETIAQFRTKAKYMIATKATKKIMWLN